MSPTDSDALLAAIQANDPVSVKALVSNGLIAPPSDLLHYAAQFGNCEIIKSLTSAGLSSYVNSFDDVSFTPLMWAATYNRIEAVKLLLKLGASVNAHDKMACGNTVLREVVESGSVELIKLLMDAGADPFVPGWMQLTAMDKARERLEIRSDLESRMILNLLQAYPLVEEVSGRGNGV